MNALETVLIDREIGDWQLVVDDVPLKGSLNMAIDDYLFHSLPDSPQTCLRFYRWAEPTVSLGFSQKTDRVVDVDFCRKKGIEIVRRITGGKLVLHQKEVTYSLCSSDSGTFTANLRDSYRMISQALIRGLEKMGLEPCLAGSPPSSYARSNSPCFAYPARDEVEVGGKKMVGSAQKRVGSRFLQQGSIPLEIAKGMLNSVSFLAEGDSEVRMTSLSQALGKRVSFTWAVERLIQGFSEHFRVVFTEKVFSKEDREEISRIEKCRYGNRSWVLDRK